MPLGVSLTFPYPYKTLDNMTFVDELVASRLTVLERIDAHEIRLEVDPVESYQVSTADAITTSQILPTQDAVKGLVYVNISGNIMLTLEGRDTWRDYYEGKESSHSSFHIKQLNATTHQIMFTGGLNTEVVDKRGNDRDRYFTAEILYVNDSFDMVVDLY